MTLKRYGNILLVQINSVSLHYKKQQEQYCSNNNLNNKNYGLYKSSNKGSDKCK